MAYLLVSITDLDPSTRRTLATAIATFAASYLLLVRLLRYRRKESLEKPFSADERSLSSMTVEEAQRIVEALQTLEFPRAFSKARQIALLKSHVSPESSPIISADMPRSARPEAFPQRRDYLPSRDRTTDVMPAIFNLPGLSSKYIRP